jgi:NAD(P)-dependent dehydrogenase (short-subunit alcohol dehydrogenase family)
VVFLGTQSAVAAPSQVRQAAYAESKGALTSVMYSLARELGPDRVRVNTVPPGWMWGPPVRVDLRSAARAEAAPEDEVLGRLARRMALPELATDRDVAEAAVFLASDRARAITGQSLLVNAGELMRCQALPTRRGRTGTRPARPFSRLSGGHVSESQSTSRTILLCLDL